MMCLSQFPWLSSDIDLYKICKVQKYFTLKKNWLWFEESYFFFSLFLRTLNEMGTTIYFSV